MLKQTAESKDPFTFFTPAYVKANVAAQVLSCNEELEIFEKDLFPEN